MNPTRRQALKTLAITGAAVTAVPALGIAATSKKLAPGDVASLRVGDRVLVRDKPGAYKEQQPLDNYGQHILVIDGLQKVGGPEYKIEDLEPTGTLESWDRVPCESGRAPRELGVKSSAWINEYMVAKHDVFLLSSVNGPLAISLW